MKAHLLTSVAIAASLMGVPAIAQTAAAQTATPAATPPPPATVKEVVITGIRASLRDALAQKRASDEIVETISSKDIGVLPDVTIAEELDRLPGINTTTDRGNASQAAVRGGGPRLVLGLVDGREVASSEPDRNVRWEIFPSEAVGSVTVYKTQSADLIAGGVAATIDIGQIRPLDYHGPEFTVRAGPVYYDGVKLPNYDPLGYRGGVEIVHKFSDELGIAFGASYQNQKNGYDSFQGWGYNTPYGGNPPILNGVPTSTPYGAQTEVDELTETRFGATTALQWKPSAEFQVNLDVLYSDVKIDEHQYQTWYGDNGKLGDWGGNNSYSYDPYYGAPFTEVNNVVTSATIPYSSITNTIAHYTENKNLLATGLNAAWRSGDWKIKGDLSYSDAQRDNDWRAIFTETYPATTTFNTGAGVTPTVSTSSNGADPSYQPLQSYRPAESQPERLRDELAAARLDATWDLHGDFFTHLDFGVRASERTKGHDEETFYEEALPGQFTLPSNLLSNYTVSGFSVPPVLVGNFNQLSQIAYGGLNINHSNVVESWGGQDGGSYAATLASLQNEWKANYWRVHETDIESYVKASFAHDVDGVPMKGNVGLRFVSVWTGSQGYQYVNGGTPTPLDIGHEYSDVLPSLNLTFSATPDMLVRLGVARVMARPPLDEMRAGRSIYTGPPPSGSAGDPVLNPFLANQVDVAWEWYFHSESLLAANVYYKDVTSNIGYKSQLVDINGTNYTITGPFNGNGGTMDGVEFTFQTPFYFVPHLEHFGIYSNLALAGSTLKEFSPVNNPLPQVGFAKTTAEASLWYSQSGFDTRIGYKYHSPYTVIYGWDASQLTRLESESIVDFSASYAFDKHYTIRFQANNLTNQVARYYWNNDPNQIARYDQYGRRILLDFTFKY
jgi:TonB-dependent receptor